jgi:hypothetical protein
LVGPIEAIDSGSALRTAPVFGAGASASKLYGGGASAISAVMLRLGDRGGAAKDRLGAFVWFPLLLALPLAPDGPDELLACSCSS